MVRFGTAKKSWNGGAILAHGRKPEKTRRGLPGDPKYGHSRFIESNIEDMLLASVYLPNGNPAPGPRVAYKLSCISWPAEHAKGLVALDKPVILAGDYNVTDRPRRI